MQADFYDAHNRHFDDADRLMSEGRLANADHLYGLAAECGLKRLMIAFGMTVTPSGSPADKADRKHADQIWQRYDSYRAGHHQGAAYPAALISPFADWSADQRYAHRRNFDTLRVTAHKVAAQTVRQLLIRAQSDGLIP